MYKILFSEILTTIIITIIVYFIEMHTKYRYMVALLTKFHNLVAQILSFRKNLNYLIIFSIKSTIVEILQDYFLTNMPNNKNKNKILHNTEFEQNISIYFSYKSLGKIELIRKHRNATGDIL